MKVDSRIVDLFRYQVEAENAEPGSRAFWAALRKRDALAAELPKGQRGWAETIARAVERACRGGQ